MINQIKTNTCAYIVKLNISKEFDFQTDILIDLSEYRFSNYNSYLVYVFDHGKLVLTSIETVVDKIISFNTKKFKKYTENDLIFIILPIDNKFAKDVAFIEMSIRDNDDITKKNSVLFPKIFTILYLVSPVLAMIFLSLSIQAYTIFFGVPSDFIDVASQINFLYKMLFDFLYIILYIIQKPVFFGIVLSVFFFIKLFHLSKRSLLFSIFKAPIFCISIFNFSNKAFRDTFFLIFFYFLMLTSVIMYTFAEEIINRKIKDSSITTIGTKLLKENINPFFITLLNYEQYSAFPKYLKTKDDKYIVIKAIKDDTVVYFDLDMMFNKLSKDHNLTMTERLCSYDSNLTTSDIYLERALTIGIDRPDYNLAQTSILQNTKNIHDIFLEKAREYKNNLCANVHGNIK